MRLALLAFVPCLLWSASPAVEEVRQRVRREGGKAASRVDQVCSGEPEPDGCLSMRAELLLKQGRLQEADQAFIGLLKQNPKDARAVLGRARALLAISFSRSARALLAQAVEMAPGDAEILAEYAVLAPRHRRPELFEKYLTLAANEPPELIQSVQTALAMERALDGKPAGRLVTTYQATEIKLVTLTSGPGAYRGVGLKVSINGQRPLTMLLDTGASGIAIPSRAAKSIGLQTVAESVFRGIGDNPEKRASLALAGSIRIGPVEFANVPVRFADSKRFPEGEGIIGANMFADFLVALDFDKNRLRLEPLSQRGATPVPEDDELYDRVISDDRKDFAKILRLGSHLHVPVHLNGGKDWYPFLIDTGANVSLIDQALAAAHTSTSAESRIRLRGASGDVKNVQSAERLNLRFAGFEQRNEGMIALDLTKISELSDFPTLGILGMPLLRMFELRIDYREGLVRFDYRGPRFR